MTDNLELDAEEQDLLDFQRKREVTMKRALLLVFISFVALLGPLSFKALSNKIWVQAEDYTKSEGSMARGSDVGIKDDEAIGDFILPTKACVPGDNPEWYIQYTVNIPRDGKWFLWGNYKHPDGGGYSFCFDKTGKGPNPGDPRLYNSTMAGKAWCWDSSLELADASPVGTVDPRIEMDLRNGSFTFRIYAREAPGNIQNSPRMDVILLTNEIEYIPTNEDAVSGLKAKAVSYHHGKLAITWGALREIR